MKKSGFRVNFPRTLARRFLRNARKVFPNEEFAICLGLKISSELIEIHELYFPKDRHKITTPDNVGENGFLPIEWFIDAGYYGKEKGLTLIGDIHSHPDDTPDGYIIGSEPSESDWHSAHTIHELTGGKFLTHGICYLPEKGSGKRSKIKFWPILSDVETKIN